jgi:misacylated tRNA(Ala) deacylase
MTEELFRTDAYATTCEATVVAVSQGEKGASVELDRTVFYATGGGQPGDSGVLRWDGGETPIAATVKDRETGAHLHIPADGAPLPPEGAAVTAKIDWERRHRHMRMHTCLHLLCSLIDAPVTGGSISEEKGRLDFDLADAPDKEALARDLNGLIEAAHPVSFSWITDAELEANPDLVRTMSVAPPRGTGTVRIVEVAGVDLQPCGGTHVANTAEIGPVRIGKIEKKGRMNRRINVVFDS